MRQRPTTVAGQLRSVAGRYQTPWAGHAVRAWPAIGLAPKAAQDTAAVNADDRRDPRLQRVEAVLFLAREPLSSRKVSQFANLADATEARTLMRRLNEIYEATGRAFCVEEIAGGYQLLTRPCFADWLRRREGVPREMRLSGPAMETLAVVAYRQPTGRAEIEAIRGVNCGEILRQLMERDLIRICGRGEELGRPYQYATTRRFLQLFGLRSLDKLPRAAAMQSGMLAEKGPEGEISNVRAGGSSHGRNEEENTVTATPVADWPIEKTLARSKGQKIIEEPIRAVDEDQEFNDFEDDEEGDEDDDLDDEDDDFDDEEDDLDDEDFDDDEWEEVEDDDEDEWDDEEDDDDDDDDDEVEWADEDNDEEWD